MMEEIYVKYKHTGEVLGSDDVFSRMNEHPGKVKLFETKEDAIAYVTNLGYGDCSWDNCEYLVYIVPNYISRNHTSSIFFDDKKELYRLDVYQTRLRHPQYKEGIEVVMTITRNNNVICKEHMSMNYTYQKCEDFILKELKCLMKRRESYLAEKLGVSWGLSIKSRVKYFCLHNLCEYFYSDFLEQFNSKGEVHA